MSLSLSFAPFPFGLLFPTVVRLILSYPVTAISPFYLANKNLMDCNALLLLFFLSWKHTANDLAYDVNTDGP